MGNLCAFKLFSLGYFVYLLLGIGVAIGLIFSLRKLSENGRKIANIIMFVCLFLFIALEFVGRIILVKDYNFFNHMPLNFFQLFAYFMAFGYFFKKTKWVKFAYLIVLPVSFFSLIFIPKFYCSYSVASICLISYVFCQSLLMAISVLNILWSDIFMGKKDILDTNITFIIMGASMHIINVIVRFTKLGVHCNLGGTMAEEYDLCIELLSSIWTVEPTGMSMPFVFLLPIFAVVVGLGFLLLIPFENMQLKKLKQSEMEELIALGNLKAQQEYRKKHMKGKSQIYVNSQTKAQPTSNKGVKNTTKTDFVAQHKEIQVNKDIKDDNPKK